MRTIAGRPEIPEVYIGSEGWRGGLLPWSYVEERLSAAKHYWLATVTPKGLPYTRPIDGFWLDDKLFFGGSESARWRRNLADNPGACVNLEDGWQAVILHGEVETVRPDHALAVRLAEASNEKYDYAQKLEDYEGVEILMFKPRVVIAWKTLYEDATRFECMD